MTTDKYFLLHPQHRDFVEGKAHYVSWTGFALGLSLCLLLLVSSAGALAWILGAYYTWHNTKQQGVQIDATLLRSRTYRHDEETRYSIDYSFEVNSTEGRREWQGTGWVTKAQVPKLEDGKPIPIRYHPADPSYSTPGHTFYSLANGKRVAAFSAIPAVMALAGVFGLALLGYACVLGRYGTLLRGRVADCQGKKDKNSFVLLVRVSFESPRGKTIEKAITCAARKDLEGQPLPAAGTPVAILYLNRFFWELL